jgi:hypothetical protein
MAAIFVFRCCGWRSLKSADLVHSLALDGRTAVPRLPSPILYAYPDTDGRARDRAGARIAYRSYVRMYPSSSTMGTML